MFNIFDLICEEKFIKRVKQLFNKVLLDIVNTTPFLKPIIITRRRSTTLRSGDDFFNTATIRILN